MKFIRLALTYTVIAFVLFMGPRIMAQVVPPNAPAVNSQGVADPTNLAGNQPDATTNEWGNSFLWAFFSSWLLKVWRSNPKLGGFSDEMELKMQRGIAVASSFIAGCGVAVVFDAHSGTLTATGLTLTALTHALRQFGFQEFAYQAAVKKMQSSPALVTQLG